MVMVNLCQLNAIFKKYFNFPSTGQICSEPNEIFNNNISPCGNTCEVYGQRCTIVNKRANTGCDCIKGYARLGEQGKCVKVDSAECVRRYSNSPSKGSLIIFL